MFRSARRARLFALVGLSLLASTGGMELVKPRLTIPNMSYEEFLIKGPVTMSYVVTVLNGSNVDVVLLDKENFIRFANKGDAEFKELASSLDSKNAYILHYSLGPGIHYLVIDNTKEFGVVKPTGDVEVSLSINIITAGAQAQQLGDVIMPTWAAAVGLAAIIIGCAAVIGLACLLCRGRRRYREVPDSPDSDVTMAKRWKPKQHRKKVLQMSPMSGDDKESKDLEV